MTLGEKIREQRKLNNFTQDELASKCGVSRRSIIDWEQDKYHPQTDLLLKLCEVLNVDVSYFAEQKEVQDIPKENIEISKEELTEETPVVAENPGVRNNYTTSISDYKAERKRLIREKAYKPWHNLFFIFCFSFVGLFLLFTVVFSIITKEVFYAGILLIVIMLISYSVASYRIHNQKCDLDLKQQYAYYESKYNDLVLFPYLPIHAVIGKRVMIKNGDDIIVDVFNDDILSVELYKDNIRYEEIERVHDGKLTYKLVLVYNDGTTSTILFNIIFYKYSQKRTRTARELTVEALNTFKNRIGK